MPSEMSNSEIVLAILFITVLASAFIALALTSMVDWLSKWYFKWHK